MILQPFINSDNGIGYYKIIMRNRELLSGSAFLSIKLLGNMTHCDKKYKVCGDIMGASLWAEVCNGITGDCKTDG